MEFYYAANNRRVGPFPASEIQSLIDQGALDGQSYIWHTGLRQEWIRVKHLPHFHLPESLEPPPTPSYNRLFLYLFAAYPLVSAVVAHWTIEFWSGNEYTAEELSQLIISQANYAVSFVVLFLLPLVVFAVMDENEIKRSGRHGDRKLTAIAVILCAPVYILQRQIKMKESKLFALVFVICVILGVMVEVILYS